MDREVGRGGMSRRRQPCCHSSGLARRLAALNISGMANNISTMYRSIPHAIIASGNLPHSNTAALSRPKIFISRSRRQPTPNLQTFLLPPLLHPLPHPLFSSPPFSMTWYTPRPVWSLHSSTYSPTATDSWTCKCVTVVLYCHVQERNKSPIRLENQLQPPTQACW